MTPPYAARGRRRGVVSVRAMDVGRSWPSSSPPRSAARSGTPVTIEALTRLPGGASRETWSFTARGRPTAVGVRGSCCGATRPARRRRGCGSRPRSSRAAARAGVPVPGVVAVGRRRRGRWAPTYMVMDFVEGETIPRRILRDEAAGRGPAPSWPRSAGAPWPPIHRIPAADGPRAPRRRPARAAARPRSTGSVSPTPPSSSGSGGWPRPVPPPSAPVGRARRLPQRQPDRRPRGHPGRARLGARPSRATPSRTSAGCA